MISRKQLDELREEIKDTIDLIDTAIQRVELEAAQMQVDPIMLRSSNGEWIMHTLLSSKIRAYHNLLIIEVLETDIIKDE